MNPSNYAFTGRLTSFQVVSLAGLTACKWSVNGRTSRTNIISQLFVICAHNASSRSAASRAVPLRNEAAMRHVFIRLQQFVEITVSLVTGCWVLLAVAVNFNASRC